VSRSTSLTKIRELAADAGVVHEFDDESMLRNQKAAEEASRMAYRVSADSVSQVLSGAEKPGAKKAAASEPRLPTATADATIFPHVGRAKLAHLALYRSKEEAKVAVDEASNAGKGRVQLFNGKATTPYQRNYVCAVVALANGWSSKQEGKLPENKKKWPKLNDYVLTHVFPERGYTPCRL